VLQALPVGSVEEEAEKARLRAEARRQRESVEAAGLEAERQELRETVRHEGKRAAGLISAYRELPAIEAKVGEAKRRLAVVDAKLRELGR
jgi:hypothetical protein